MTEFNWNEHREELDAMIKCIVKEHDDYFKTSIGEFLKNKDADVGKEWVCVIWYNASAYNFERYKVGNIGEAQEMIDFYHFSEARTKVIRCHNGEDVTDRIKFNPLYRDILDDERLKN